MVSVDLLAPLAYVAVLVTALGLFSSVYRRRKAADAVVEPWFPTHQARDLYITLLQSNPPAPEALLKSALLLRAMADVRRIWKMRDDKTALAVLIQKGSVGDDLLVRFAKAEKELESEVLDVVNEANSFTPAWGPGIFQTASEMVANEKLKEDFNKLEQVKLREEAKHRTQKAESKTILPSSDFKASISTSPSTATLSPATPSKSTLIPTPSVSNVSTPPASPGPASTVASPGMTPSTSSSAETSPPGSTFGSAKGTPKSTPSKKKNKKKA